MRKEIIGIFLFFLVIFSLISLISYSPGDPSIHNAKAFGDIENLFGVFGAHLAGALVGLFGVGAFWIPFVLLLACIQFFGPDPGRGIALTTSGGILLVVTTGSLLAFRQEAYILFDSRFSAGGIVGIPLQSFLVSYANPTGAAIILSLAWLVGFIMSTGFSLVNFGRRGGRLAVVATEGARTSWIKWRERREKSRKRTQKANAREAKQKRDIQIKTPEPKPVRDVPAPKQEVFDFMHSGSGYVRPSVNFLDGPGETLVSADDENLKMLSRLVEKKLEDFGVDGKVVSVAPGPVVTTFEYEPAPGVKINRIVSLTDDLALALRATAIRIVAPIPGKAAIGIEIPNATRDIVRFKEIVVSAVYEKSKSTLTLCLGKDIVGQPVVAELDKMPHFLIAGATGTGKSVALNAMICSFLYKASPEDVRLIMIDPKRIELSHYDGIPHLITPVVTNPKKATNALFWAVREMERRYELLSEIRARNIKQYNQKIQKKTPDGDTPPPEKLPFIVIIIDELADLMMVASRDVEVALTRLAQMARAAGIHLILATQRPSVDVLTGIIKANFPTRLTFQVSSRTDSRTIIDTVGAENLLGSGDMLFLPPGTAKLQRIHGAYISEAELARITEFLKQQESREYDRSVTAAPPKVTADIEEDAYDEKYDEAVALVTRTRQASISMIQRHLRIGYNRAARIIEVMEREGIVGPSDGAKPRAVLVRGYDEEGG
ncbi:DNA translocase FtsK [Olavius algarvensis associated proteobacterium Delta 3]|nr:DNA translocase FtsK [Olavius algarvensis associated proteobacterium Delta 3]